MKVPFLNLSEQVKPLKKQIIKGWERALDSAHFILGSEVSALEAEAAKFLGCPHAVAVNSGTDALVLGLRALGVGKGDEVLTTAFSFFATAEAISLAGAKPVFCDINPATFLLDEEEVLRRMNSRIKAVLPVHLYGLPMPLSRIKAAARKKGIKILEDAAQAFGAFSREGACGTVGDCGAFSFYPTKNLGGCGDGGLITTGDAKVAGKARELRNHASNRRYFHNDIGYCSRLDELQAIALRVKLPLVKAWNRRRSRIARAFLQGLASLEPRLGLPKWDDGCIWHQFTIRTPRGLREGLMAHLQKRGIASMIFYPLSLHQQKPYAKAGLSLPHCESAAREVLCLPIYAEMKDGQVAYVIRTIREYFQA
jgi:dTDP-4-amino-4,6-dideoxygalactose transaminase